MEATSFSSKRKEKKFQNIEHPSSLGYVFLAGLIHRLRNGDVIYYSSPGSFRKARNTSLECGAPESNTEKEEGGAMQGFSMASDSSVYPDAALQVRMCSMAREKAQQLWITEHEPTE